MQLVTLHGVKFESMASTFWAAKAAALQVMGERDDRYAKVRIVDNATGDTVLLVYANRK
jgi:hypothetical protein